MANGTSAGAPPPPTQAQKQAEGIYTVEGLRNLAGVRRPFLVEDVVLMGSTNIVIGDSGLGKTALVMQAGLCVSSGRPFLGHPVVQGPVLYCDGESNKDEFIEMAEKISTYLGLPRAPDEFEVWSPNFDQASSSVSMAGQLEAKVRFARPLFVIVDPLRVFWPAAEEKPAATMAMYATYRQLTKDIGCTWATVHHLRKEDKKNRVTLETDRHRWFQEAAGSRALINHADTRLGVESTSNGGADLVLAGFMRGIGWLESSYLARIPDDVGKPIGYQLVKGAGVLSPLFQQVFNSLSDPFRFTNAKQALGGTSDSNTMSFLNQCQAAGLIQKSGKLYMKLVP